MFSSTSSPPQSPSSAPLALPTTCFPPPAPLGSLPALPSPPTSPTSSPSRKRYPCPHCLLDFPKSGNRNRHIENKHPRELGRSKVECAFCGQSFWDSKKLNKHATLCQGALSGSAPQSAEVHVEEVEAMMRHESSSSPSHVKRSLRPSSRSSLTTAAINQASTDFFMWLTEPPLPTEHMLRKVATPEAVAQQQEALRQLVREADVEMPSLFNDGIQLRQLVLPDVVKTAITAMQQRKVCVTMMSVLVYASVVRIAVWDGCRQSLLLDKLCRIGMATCHCGCHVNAALSRSGFASDVLSCSLLESISSSIDRK